MALAAVSLPMNQRLKELTPLVNVNLAVASPAARTTKLLMLWPVKVTLPLM